MSEDARPAGLEQRTLDLDFAVTIPGWPDLELAVKGLTVTVEGHDHELDEESSRDRFVVERLVDVGPPDSATVSRRVVPDPKGPTS